jgi:hypothetical protein
MRTDPRSATPPPRRVCTVCGGLRRSHVAYLGGNREAVVYRCESCGTTQQGPVVDRAERVAASRERGSGGAGGGGKRRRERPLPDGGVPDNPVINSDMARLLSERFGGE